MSCTPGAYGFPILASDPPAPVAGLVLYVVGTELRYRTPTIGPVVVGVTSEGIQDIVGALIQDSATIDAVYNDAGNILSMDIEAALVTLINNSVQPGDNISDLTNNSGFETPAQLNARDVNNRARANHTGSQLASTISDFANETRDTVLTGLATGDTSLVVAADSILVAIGKLQAQLSDLPPFGQEAEDFLDTAQVNFSGAISEVKSYTTASKPPGRYRVAATVQFEPASTGNNDEFELRVNGSLVSLHFEAEAKDTGGDVRDTRYLYGYYQHPSTGTFDIEIYGGNGTGTTELNGVIAEVWRVA